LKFDSASAVAPWQKSRYDPGMDEKPKPRASGAFIAIGLCMGTAIGAALHNVALGAAFGLLAGAVLMAIDVRKPNK